MPLEKDVNSFATVEEADEYFETRIDSAAWTVAVESQKEAALVTATAVLDAKRWLGTTTSPEQVLSFPRLMTFIDPISNMEKTVNTTPLNILKACYEIAYHLLNNPGILDDVGSVGSLGVGPIKLDNIKAPSAIPSIARSLIAPYLAGRSDARMWWRAN